ncbi:type III secretion system chaperone [Ramlibacter rhizophilus]|uniref:Type III secretion system chaperone n=1 Tax=Ramlibacter rhizophilus TaxID=1781167 RepID=A0A4Z0BB14_9BURK|nr:type III secretion system chaperone [Ramlibacter rhizophilus]TFY96272.1 hypothetical protein EZ242_21745 [Ramlibacter rhizophilus]
MHFQELMNRLGVELRLPPPAPDPQGACALSLDGMTLSFYPDADDAVTLMCPLGQVDIGDLDTQESLLAGNLFPDGVGGSAVGLDAQGQAWLSQRFHPGQLAFPRFLASLERFANLAECWRQCLETRTMPRFTH